MNFSFLISVLCLLLTVSHCNEALHVVDNVDISPDGLARTIISDEFEVSSSSSSSSSSSPEGREIEIEREREIYIVGDVHGNFDALKQVLVKAGIIDYDKRNLASAPCDWSRAIRDDVNKKDIWLVQVGDIVDRGNTALECWKCLENLQESAPTNAKLFRMLGNHELWWLEGLLHMKAPADSPANIKYIVDAIKNDVLNDKIFGSVALSTSKGDVLLTHAGIQGGFLPYFEKKFKKSTNEVITEDNYQEVVNAKSISVDINEAIKIAIRSCSKSGEICTFSDKIFKAGKDRGGKGIGGPFWSDFSSVLDSYNKGLLAKVNFTQIVGHTAAKCAYSSDDCIRSSDDGNVICVDGGLYMGSNSFLKISNDGEFTSNEYDEQTGKWVHGRRIK